MAKYIAILHDENGNHSEHKVKCDTVAEAVQALERWSEQVGRYGDERGAGGLLYLADQYDTRDAFPVKQLVVGARGACRALNC